jgi:hypothetical protein
LYVIAGLLSGQRVDESGNREMPVGSELQPTWEYLRSRYPRDFTSGH